MANQIHPSAIISEKAELGNNLIIGPYTVIDDFVKIGDGTIISNGVRLLKKTVIGKNCNIHSYATLGDDPQFVNFKDIDTNVEVGDNTTIREFVTIHRGTEYRYKTTVGDNCFIMAYAHIGHDCEVRNSVIMANGVQLAGHVVVDDFTNIGGLTTVHQFCKVGSYCMISGSSAINKDVPPYSLIHGVPAKYYRINLIGLRRRGFTPEQITEIGKIYDILFHSGLAVNNAVKKIESDIKPSPEMAKILDFISNCKRGLIRAVND